MPTGQYTVTDAISFDFENMTIYVDNQGNASVVANLQLFRGSKKVKDLLEVNSNRVPLDNQTKALIAEVLDNFGDLAKAGLQ